MQKSVNNSRFSAVNCKERLFSSCANIYIKTVHVHGTLEVELTVPSAWITATGFLCGLEGGFSIGMGNPSGGVFGGRVPAGPDVVRHLGYRRDRKIGVMRVHGSKDRGCLCQSVAGGFVGLILPLPGECFPLEGPGVMGLQESVTDPAGHSLLTAFPYKCGSQRRRPMVREGVREFVAVDAAAATDTISQRRVAIEVAGLGGSADLTGKYRFLIDIGPDWCIDCIARIGCDTGGSLRYGLVTPGEAIG